MLHTTHILQRRAQRAVGTIALAAVLISSLGVAAAAATRIHIPHGHGTVLVHGHLYGANDTRHYVLYARRHQLLSLLMLRGGPSVVMVTFPNGQQNGAPGGVDITLTQTGNNQILISEHHMGQPWRGPFTLRVRLH